MLCLSRCRGHGNGLLLFVEEGGGDAKCAADVVVFGGQRQRR